MGGIGQIQEKVNMWGRDTLKITDGASHTVKAVIQESLGEKQDISFNGNECSAVIRYILTEDDLHVLQKIKKEHPKYIIREGRG